MQRDFRTLSDERIAKVYDALKDKRIVVIGAGGAGTWACISLLMFCPSIRLAVYDDDVIETSNLNRLPYSPKWIGKSKVLALARIVEFLGLEIEPHFTKFDPSLITSEVYIYIDASDDLKFSLELFHNVTGFSLYCRIGYESDQSSVFKAIPEFGIDDGKSGYETNASNIYGALGSSVMLFRFLYQKINFSKISNHHIFLERSNNV